MRSKKRNKQNSIRARRQKIARLEWALVLIVLIVTPCLFLFLKKQTFKQGNKAGFSGSSHAVEQKLENLDFYHGKDGGSTQALNKPPDKTPASTDGEETNLQVSSEEQARLAEAKMATMRNEKTEMNSLPAPVKPTPTPGSSTWSEPSKLSGLGVPTKTFDVLAAPVTTYEVKTNAPKNPRMPRE